MTARRFMLRGLKHYRSAYVGVLLGTALGTMVLLGSLFSGDSVKSTLTTIAKQRIGQTSHALIGGENFFRAKLASDLGNDTAAILQLRGQTSTSDGRSTGQVDFLGVDDAFWSFAPTPTAEVPITTREWAINQALALSLELHAGDALIIRLRKPGLIAHDAPLSGTEDEIISLRGKVGTILSNDQMGRFSLKATQQATPAVYLPIERLAEMIEQPGKANLLLFKNGDNIAPRVREAMTLADYGLSLLDVPKSGQTAFRSDRVFIPPAIEEKIRKEFPDSETRVLTYMVNSIIFEDRDIPYSMVTGRETTSNPPETPQITLNSWAADDLGAKAGDSISLTYYLLRNGRLEEDRAQFTVKDVIPLEGAAADPLWMPDFPGIKDAENSSDWTPGMPLDLDRIREKDETYWDEHRGTPKAFIDYAVAKDLWQNRWGSSTGLRAPVTDVPKDELEKRTLAILEPADAGFMLRDIASESAAAATSPTNIAGLFASMSFFLILAAIALTAMLFRFNVEQRNRETGLLTALGISPKKILHWRLGEGFIIVVLGTALGTLLALVYTQGLLRFLETIWDSSGQRLFQFRAAPASIIGGMLGMILLTMVTIWFSSRKQARTSASLRLESGIEEIQTKKSRAIWIALFAAISGLSLIFSMGHLQPQGAFFGGGFCLLVAGLAYFKARCSKVHAHLQTDGETTPPMSTQRLAKLNLSRRATRSLVVVGTLASGIFLVISVAAFQKHGGTDWHKPRSGAGGYAFWIETSSPLARQSDGHFEFESENSTEVLPIRLGAGDDASCFNLNSVAQPRLLAANTDLLENRFTIKSTLPGIDPSWSSLKSGDTLRAFVDETTLLWAIKRKLGDRITYTDDTGNPFEVEIVGTLADSVFQGSFVVDETRFLERYPSTGGYRVFLTNSNLPPTEGLPQLQRTLADLGATVTTTSARIESFHGVENTYIAIFHVLGGLGVILGSAGLGIVTARNLSERREEFRVLRVLGIPAQKTRSLIWREIRHAITWALVIGLSAAMVSIIPLLPDTHLVTVFASIGIFMALILCTTITAAWLAVRRHFQGELVKSDPLA